MLAGFTHEPVVQLSERLIELAPEGLGHCFYASDGASATEIALKMSAHFWRNSGKPDKTQFISLENSYHGETLGALSVTDVALFRDAYGALIRQQATVPSPDWRKADSGGKRRSLRLRCAMRWSGICSGIMRSWPRSSSSRWCRARRAWRCITRPTCGARGSFATNMACT